jgi:ribosomal-protein-alanine N-acetyltransferase
VTTPDDSFPTLETLRLRLREIVPSDAPTLLEIHGDAETMRWFGRNPITTLDEAHVLVENFASLRASVNTGVRWGLELLEPALSTGASQTPDGRRLDALRGRLIGTCGFFRWNRGWRVSMLGYELARAAQGRGFMSEALRTAFAWGFEEMALDRIEAMVHSDNEPSLSLLKSLGFVEEGRAREAGFWLGKRHDMVHLGLLQREFFAG